MCVSHIVSTDTLLSVSLLFEPFPEPFLLSAYTSRGLVADAMMRMKLEISSEGWQEYKGKK